MRIFLLIFMFISPAAFAASAAYSIVPAAGATFDATVGIIPVATPYTFTATAANDAVIGSKTIPITAATPYGSVSGSAKIAGIFSKPVAASVGKSLLKLALPVQIGMALYDAYKAANMTIDPTGLQIMSVPPAGFGTSPSCIGSGALSAWQDFVMQVGAGNTCLKVVTANAACYAANVASYCQAISWTATVASGLTDVTPAPTGTPAPATDVQKQAAVDAFANASGANSARLMGDAQKAGVAIPDTPIDPAASPAPFAATTPWQSVGTQTDAAGNKQTIQKSATVEATPTVGAPSSSPIPVKIIENTQYINNTTNTVNNSSTSTVVNQQSGATPAPAVTPPPNPVTEYCQQHPDAGSCADVRTGGLPVETIGKRTVNVSSDLTHFSFTGTAVCPADRSLVIGGKTLVYSYKPFCDFLSIFRFAALAVALFVSGLIIMGQRTGGNE